MQTNEIWTEYKVSASDYGKFMFSVKENQRGFKITINSNILETDKNIIYTFFRYEEFQKWENWRRTRVQPKRDNSGNLVTTSQGLPLYVTLQPPPIKTFFSLKTNMIDKKNALS